MSFRKQPQHRIFVDESIPSFLANQPKKSATAPVSLSNEQVATSPPPSSATQPRFDRRVDRRQQPLKLTPAFLAQLIAMSVALNTALYWLFQLPSNEPDVLVRLEAPQTPAEARREEPLDERIVTFELDDAETTTP